MSTELAALRCGLAPRRSAVGSLLALPVADVAAMLGCFVAGGLLNFSFQNVTEERTLILALLIAGSLVVFQHFGHYSRRRQFWQELGDIAMVAAGALLFDLALLYLLKVNFSRLWVLTSWALVVPAVPLARLLVKKVALELGHWLQPTVIVGVGPNALEIAAAYDARNNHLGYQVQAFLDPCGAGEAGRARRGGGRALAQGRRARDPGPGPGPGGQGAAGLAGPAARGGGARARRDAGPRGADREPVLLPWRHRRDLAA